MNLLISDFENEVQLALLSFASKDIDNFYIHHNNAGKIIKILAENKKIEEALSLEAIFYKKLVKIIETEDHYNKSFSIFKDELWNCGKYFSDKKNILKPSKIIAFALQSNVILGHVKIGKGSFIGSACSINPYSVIEDNVLLGTGSNVFGKLKSKSIYYGNKARFIRKNNFL